MLLIAFKGGLSTPASLLHLSKLGKSLFELLVRVGPLDSLQLILGVPGHLQGMVHPLLGHEDSLDRLHKGKTHKCYTMHI